MNNFIPKKIAQTDSCGEKLRAARLRKNWSLSDIAKHLSIKEEYLKSIEDDRLDQLPAGLYGKNFIKKYARLLKLDCEKLVVDWEGQVGKEIEDPFSRKVIARHQFIVFPKLIRNVLILLAVAVCFLYLISYFRDIVLPPKMEVIYPETNLALSATNLTVSGITEPETEVRINGEIVLNNDNGHFKQNINLKKGLNNIVIRAKKKYSQEKVITRQILVE